MWGTALLLGALCACTPGGEMESGDYPIIPITPQLIAQMNAEKAQAAPQQLMVPLPPSAANYRYAIGPGDVLSYRLWEGMNPSSAEQNQPLAIKIEASGKASLPLIGEVKASGQSIEQLRADVGKKLAKYFKQPKFDLQLQEMHSSYVTISGAVMKPGMHYLTYEPLTVSQALEQAGGAQPYADLTQVTLQHKTGAREQLDGAALLYHGDASQERVLAAGDTLIVSENHRNRVFLMGEAIKPGALYIKDSRLSLTEALNDPQSPAGLAQGPNVQQVTIGNIYVIRGAMVEDTDGRDAATKTPPPIMIYRLDTSQPANYAVADRFLLAPRDVIYISSSAITEWHRIISQLLPSNFGISKGVN